ncbi:hypothetical protein SeMB42_g05692 [Synchytrium endobioticum]|uniref:Uncharacterized protein n=1 Tax=Synchytrium endobioticum TaxID=286115 RepID=A0A507CUH5_9FUNG|nr:hypothetical protein SeMB42_g05692 [Synchytrium endobioticum]TPX42765.1 hypothetical protein SeLEV6574_g05418 [Synchytrium endobioticum]
MSADLLSELRPLPEDILLMNESETACQYCGISYLLQNKYEKLERHVRDLECDLQHLKHLETERPELLERMQIAEDGKMHAEDMISELESRAEQAERETEEATIQLNKMQNEWKKMAEQLASTLASDKAKASSRNQIAIHVLSTISKTKSLMKSYILQQKALRKEAISQLLHVVNNKISSVTANAVLQAESAKALADQKCGALEAELRSEIRRYQNALKESDERCERLAQSMEKSQCASNEVTWKHQSYINQLETSITDLQRRLADSDLLLEQSARERGNLFTQVQQQQTVMNAERVDSERQFQARMQEAQTRVEESEEKSRQLISQVKTLESQCDELRGEKRNCADGYEARMRELQEEYRQQIEELGRNHTMQRRRLCDEREAALTLVRETVKKEHDVIIASLQHQVEDLRRARDAARNDVIRVKRESEEETDRRLSGLKEELRSIKVKSAEEVALARTQILCLESQLASRPPPPPSSTSCIVNQSHTSSFFPPIHSSCSSSLTSQPMQSDTTTSVHQHIQQQLSQEISELKQVIARRDADVQFLRETVKMECEERMTLLSELETLRRRISTSAAGPAAEGTASSNTSHAETSERGSRPSTLKKETNGRTRPSTAEVANMSPEQRAFELRMREVARIKQAKMSKDSSGSYGPRRK